MRFIKLATVGRRAGATVYLKNLRHQIIATMTLNPATGVHEFEMPEPDFLKNAKTISELCQIPACAVYVTGIRDDAEAPALPPAAQEFIAGYNLAMDGRPLLDKSSDSAKAGWNAAKAFGHKVDEPKSAPKSVEGIVPVPHGTPFFKLKSIAKNEGVNIEGVKGVEAITRTINEARMKRIIATA